MRDEPLRWLLASIINQGLLPEELAQLQRVLARGALGQVSMKKCLKESSQKDPKSLLRKRMCGECVTLSHCASQFGNPGKESRKSRCATFANEKLRLGNQIEIRLKICSELFFDWKIFSLPFSDSPDLVAGSQSSERPAPFLCTRSCKAATRSLCTVTVRSFCHAADLRLAVCLGRSAMDHRPLVERVKVGKAQKDSFDFIIFVYFCPGGFLKLERPT